MTEKSKDKSLDYIAHQVAKGKVPIYRDGTLFKKKVGMSCCV